MITHEQVVEGLRSVEDPELHRSVVDLGMVRDIRVTGTEVTVRLALTIIGCPLLDYFQRVVQERVRVACPGVNAVYVELTSMSEVERARVIANVRGQVPKVGSGKGGVGKSTVAVNLAAALAAAGHRVGLLDADFWGFSVPHLTGATGRPTVVDDLIMPLPAHGFTVLSIGNFLPEDGPVVWRGPMLHKTLQQLLADVHWDDREYLVIDMPPGTGDVAISLSQFLPTADFLLVTTPHASAERVARRAGQMMVKAGLRLAGVVENMAGLVCESCGREHSLFGVGAGERLATALDVPLLASIPLAPALSAAGEEAVPLVIARPESTAARRFARLAEAIAGQPSRYQRRLLPILT